MLTVYSRINVAYHAGVFRGGRISSLVVGREEIRASLKKPAWKANGKIAEICLAVDGDNRNALWVMMHWRIFDLLSPDHHTVIIARVVLPWKAEQEIFSFLCKS